MQMFSPDGPLEVKVCRKSTIKSPQNVNKSEVVNIDYFAEYSFCNCELGKLMQLQYPETILYFMHYVFCTLRIV